MTYLLLSAGLIATAIGVRGAAEVAARRRGRRIPLRPTLLTALVLLPVTVVFDNVMIAAGLFAYSDAAISGLRIGLAPLEDLAYPLAVVLLAPAVWALTARGAADAPL